ncbi:MAG: PAS domain S-box protein [Syntrophobacteraceae bacterium]|jgi:PAS domain S-box-containing protein
MIWDRTNRPVWLRCTAGVLAAVIAAAIRFQFLEIIELRATFLTFYPAVVVAALYGGISAGLVATIVSAALADYFWVEPVGQFSIANSADLLSMIVFLASGALISCLAEAAYRAQARAHEAEELSKLAAESEKAAVDLQQSESKYRELVQNANSAIIRWTRDGTITFFNEYAQRFFGYSVEEVIGKNVKILVPEQESTGGHLTGLVQDVVNHPERYANNINENILRDGSRVWMAWTNRPVFDQDGQVLEILAVGSDITARKQAEEELRQSREWLGTTLRSIGDAVIATNASGLVTFLNPVAEKLTGWEPGAALDQPIQNVFRVINEQNRQPADNVVERVLREGNIVSLANHTALITRDGREIPIEDSAAPIRDKEGGVAGVVLVFHDVTERRRVREALRESEERLRLFIGYAPASLAMFDCQMRYLSASRRWLTDYNLEQTELSGLSHYEVFPEIPEYWKQAHLRGLAGEVVRADADRFDRIDGSVQWLRWEVRPWYKAAGDVGGIVIFSEDITERQQMLEKIESLARFPDENPKPVLRISSEGKLLYANRGSATLLKASGWKPGETLPGDWLEHALQTLSSGCSKEMELTCEEVVYSLMLIPVSDLGYLDIYGHDITERKRMEMERETAVEFLHFVNQSSGTTELVRAAAAFFQRRSGCEAVGIRLKEGDDYPYLEARGFSREFVEMENSLCARDAAGNILRDIGGDPYIECMCGNIICGRVDPSRPFFSPGGSFWTNSTTRLLAATSDADRQTRTRNRCNGEGYESVALIPLNFGAERMGLLQLNDRREGMFSPEIIAQWERLAGYLAVALARSKAEEALHKAHDELELRVQERTAQLSTANENLREQAALLDLAHDAILVRDPDNKILYWNAGAEKTYGWTKEEALGKSSHTLLKTRFPKPLEELTADLLRNEEWEGELDHITKSGEQIIVASRWAIQRGPEGNPCGMLEIDRDISERKKAEEQVKLYMAKLEQSNHALQDFASIAAHDLKEPLRKVISFGNMLRQKCEDSLGQTGNDYLTECSTQRRGCNPFWRDFWIIHELRRLQSHSRKLIFPMSSEKFFPTWK